MSQPKGSILVVGLLHDGRLYDYCNLRIESYHDLDCLTLLEQLYATLEVHLPTEVRQRSVCFFTAEGRSLKVLEKGIIEEDGSSEKMLGNMTPAMCMPDTEKMKPAYLYFMVPTPRKPYISIRKSELT